jgi:transposase
MLDKKQVKNLYHSGMNMRQVAEELGVSNSDICQFMIKYNINSRPSGSKASGDGSKRVKLDKEQIISMYESGMSQAKIGKALGVSNALICKFMKRNGIDTRGNKREKPDEKKVAALYEAGNSSEKISKVFGVTSPTIRRFMKKYGIQLRKDKKIGVENE